MDRKRTLSQCMRDRGIEIEQLVELSGLEKKVVEAIVAARFTTSPRQRQRLADVLAVSADGIQWGQAGEVEHMYGHGPQFGRSP